MTNKKGVIILKKRCNDNYMSKKELIQFRIKSEDKKRIKEIAEKQGKSVSEILCNYINEVIEKDDIKEKYQEQLDKRVVMTEKKLLELKRKLRGADNNGEVKK